MKAAYLNTEKELYVGTSSMPEPSDDEVLIRICYSGICGSDLHYYHEGRVGDNVIRKPHILGHESSGVVEGIGKGVTTLSVGDRVAIEPGVPCLSCSYCFTGQYNLCESVRFMGAPPYPGTFQEYLCHKALFTHKLAEEIDLKTGALIEPLAVGFNAVSRLSLKPSQRLLISGAGPIGLSTMLIARAAGARVTITDVDDYHLDFARSAGADEVINIRNSELEANRYDCAVEASGNVEAFGTLLSGVRKGSRLVLVGMTSTPLCLNVNSILKKSLSILAVYRYANHFQPVMDLLREGRIDTRGFITHEYGIDDILKAFKFADNPAEKKIKVVIKFD